jgi:aldehyde reductase
MSFQTMQGQGQQQTQGQGQMQDQGKKYEHNLSECGIDFNLNTGDNIPALGLGTWQVDPSQIGDIVRKAIEMGYRHFDCSPEYGNQQQIGEVLNEYIHTKGFGRNNFFITSKLGTGSHNKREVKNDLERTLRELQVHHLDLFLMHYPLGYQTGQRATNVPLEETWREMEALMKDGKTRAVGVSNFNLQQLRDLEKIAKIKPAVAQFENHPYLIQRDIIEFCNRHGIVVVCQAPLGSVAGHDELMRDPTLNQIATKYNKNPCQLILRWNIQNRRCVIPKCRDLSHLQDNLKVFGFEITKEDLDKIDSLHQGKNFLGMTEKMGAGLGMGMGMPEERKQGSQVGAR